MMDQAWFRIGIGVAVGLLASAALLMTLAVLRVIGVGIALLALAAVDVAIIAGGYVAIRRAMRPR
ncbi:MAG: hypothetical protein FJ318_10520 [SAR202 cluster bacterium]|nr:hypothetical protein [SAR202 cluster bacterium]